MGGFRSSSPRSSAVYTATTPGMERASSTSTDRMVPWAVVERTKWACSRSSNCWLATYSPRPRISVASSRRSTALPRMEVLDWPGIPRAGMVSLKVALVPSAQLPTGGRPCSLGGIALEQLSGDNHLLDLARSLADDH